MMHCPRPVAAPLGPCGATCTPMDRQEFTDILAGRRFVKVRCQCAVGHSFFVEVELEVVEGLREEELAPQRVRVGDPLPVSGDDLCANPECRQPFARRTTGQRYCTTLCGRRAREHPSPRRRWTPAEKSRFLTLWNGGTQSSEIEAAFQLARGAASGYACAFRNQGEQVAMRAGR